jgi:hypothetical protein
MIGLVAIEDKLRSCIIVLVAIEDKLGSMYDSAGCHCGQVKKHA